jgi:chaperonin GroEL
MNRTMATTFGGVSTLGLMASSSGLTSTDKVSMPSRNVRYQRKYKVKAAKELYFNKDGSAIKKLQVLFWTIL